VLQHCVFFTKHQRRTTAHTNEAEVIHPLSVSGCCQHRDIYPHPGKASNLRATQAAFCSTTHLVDAPSITLTETHCTGITTPCHQPQPTPTTSRPASMQAHYWRMASEHSCTHVLPVTALKPQELVGQVVSDSPETTGACRTSLLQQPMTQTCTALHMFTSSWLTPWTANNQVGDGHAPQHNMLACALNHAPPPCTCSYPGPISQRPAVTSCNRSPYPASSPSGQHDWQVHHPPACDSPGGGGGGGNLQSGQSSSGGYPTAVHMRAGSTCQHTQATRERSLAGRQCPRQQRLLQTRARFCLALQGWPQQQQLQRRAWHAACWDACRRGGGRGSVCC
jgi:hypothetical protein